MALLRAFGTTVLSTTNDFDLFTSQTGLKHYSTFIFLHNLVVDSIVSITVQVFDPNPTAELRNYDFQEFRGVQGVPALYSPFVPSEGGYNIIAKRSSSSPITLTWSRFEAI